MNDKSSGPQVLKGRRKLKGLSLEGIVLGRGIVERKSREKKGVEEGRERDTRVRGGWR